MNQSTHFFEMFAGDDRRLRVTVTDDAGQPKSLAGASIDWVMAQTPTSAPVLTKTLGSGIVVVDEDGGVFDVVLVETDTADKTPAHYAHQSRVVDAAEDTVTVVSGWCHIKPSIPRGT